MAVQHVRPYAHREPRFTGSYRPDFDTKRPRRRVARVKCANAGLGQPLWIAHEYGSLSGP
jgi:hypothetical protein